MEVPEEWLKVIQKPDGSWKKIIFYNTSVSALLQNGEKMLRKMEDVFAVFKEKRDEVALLWRPHPLIKATIESMRPELWEEYEKIVEKYCGEKWGIYDDSAELDRAIEVSDSYYGDGSSVVRLFQEAGKPVMIQNTETVIQGKFPISFDCTYQENNDIWFVGNKDNCLWNMKLDTKQLKYVALVPSNSENMFRRNTRCIKYKNNIFCLPDLDDKIAIYDICTNEFTYCEIGGKGEERRSIYNAWVCGSTLWCISYCMQRIIEIDLGNINVKRMYPVFQKPEQMIGYESTICGGNIYFVSRSDTIIGKFNLLTKKIRYYKLDIDDKGFNTIISDGCDFYMTGYKKAVYVWNENTNQIKVNDDFPCEYKVYNLKKEEERCYESPIFYRSAVIEKYIAFLPWNVPGARSNGMLLYDKFKGKLLYIKDESYPENQNFPLCCVGYRTSNDAVGFFSIEEGNLIEIDGKLQLMYPGEFEISGYKNMFFDMDWEKKVLVEQRKFDIKVWLELMRNQKNKMNEKINVESGKLIWDMM